MDNAALPGVDVVHDLLDFPYPFPDNSADEVYLNHVLEHFVLSDTQRILREIYRILRPGGVLHLRVPQVFSIAAWADPTHKSTYTFVSGEFFTVNSMKAYYKELNHLWHLTQTHARVTWFNWKWYRLRQLDNWLSHGLSGLINWLLRRANWPGAADLLVKALPIFFVEIDWALEKPR
jgi:SAM-dependent methyltransferase